MKATGSPSFYCSRIAAVFGLTLIGLASPLIPAEGATSDAALFAEGRVVRIEIDVAPSDMDELKLTQKFKGMGERKDYPVTVREGGKTYYQVAMHLKGAIGSFRPIDQNPALTLNFDKHRKRQRFYGLEKISLNNSVQDPTLVSERLARELYRRAGIPAPRVGYARVTLNGRDLGVYVLAEGYDRRFLKQHFENADGNLYDGGLGEEIQVDGRQPVNSGRTPKDQSRLQNLMSAAREPDYPVRYARLDQVLDLDRFLSLIALDVMIGNWDGYALGRNNYRIYDDISARRLVFLPHGLDQTFQSTQATIVPRMPGLVARALVETPQGSVRYLERMEELTGKLFDVAALTNRVLQMAAVPRRELALRDPELAKAQDLAVGRYCANIAQRVASVREQLAGARHPLPFDVTGAARLKNWSSSAEFGQPTFNPSELVPEALRIRTDHGAVVSMWSTKAWLPKGRYRFEGRVKTTALLAAPGDPRGGAGLRTGNRWMIAPLSGDNDWRTIEFPFEVFDPIYQVQLVCEARAVQGEALFDRDSLRLVRLPPE